jgi:hypothetical protein
MYREYVQAVGIVTVCVVDVVDIHVLYVVQLIVRIYPDILASVPVQLNVISFQVVVDQFVGRLFRTHVGAVLSIRHIVPVVIP